MKKEQIQRFLPSSKLNAKTTTSSHGTPLMFAATSDSKSTPALYFLYSDFDLSDVRLTDVGSLYYNYPGELSMKCIFSVITFTSGNASYCMFESFSWGESNYCRLNRTITKLLYWLAFSACRQSYWWGQNIGRVYNYPTTTSMPMLYILFVCMHITVSNFGISCNFILYFIQKCIQNIEQWK